MINNIFRVSFFTKKIAIPSLLFFAIVSCKKSSQNITPTPLPADSASNIAYGRDPLQQLDMWLPANRTADSTKVIICIHGGGWGKR